MATWSRTAIGETIGPGAGAVLGGMGNSPDRDFPGACADSFRPAVRRRRATMPRVVFVSNSALSSYNRGGGRGFSRELTYGISSAAEKGAEVRQPRGTVEEGSQLHLSVDPIMPHIGCYPCCDDLHPDPRFQALLRKICLPAVDRTSERVP